MEEKEIQDPSPWDHAPVVFLTQHSISAEDIQFNLSKKASLKSKRGVGIQELQTALENERFRVIIVRPEEKKTGKNREIKPKTEKITEKPSTKPKSPSFSKEKSIKPQFSLTEQPATTANPVLSRSFSPSKAGNRKISDPIADNLTFIARLALKLAKSPVNDGKSQVSETMTSFSSESRRKTEGNRGNKLLPAIFESSYEAKAATRREKAERGRLRARLVRSVAAQIPLQHSPGLTVDSSPLVRSPLKPPLDCRITANPILRHFGRLYGLQDPSPPKPASDTKAEDARQDTAHSQRRYDLAHISFDRSLNPGGFSPFRCTKRDLPSAFSSLY